MDLRWHLKVGLVKLAIQLVRLSGFYEGYYGHWRYMFNFVQRKGLHIIPVHYYSPIPDTRKLPDALWQQQRMPIGFDLNVDTALGLLDRFCGKFGNEYKAFSKEPDNDMHKYYLNNTAYSLGDAEILYSMIREFKPRKIVEIGSGYSTLLICQAIRANKLETPDYRCEFVAIEPFPPSFLKPPPAEVDRLESKPLQQMPSDLWASLGTNDILFIDSTHVARIGSDVIHEYLSIVPSLAAGVVVHIHDIFIPADYPRRWIDEARFFWNEQYLLEAFLSYNPNFEVIMPTHAIWLNHNEYFNQKVSSVDSESSGPSSFWIRRRTTN
jgi:Methyltransferase domain